LRVSCIVGQRGTEKIQLQHAYAGYYAIHDAHLRSKFLDDFAALHHELHSLKCRDV
jgi:hypothetical protein